MIQRAKAILPYLLTLDMSVICASNLSRGKGLQGRLMRCQMKRGGFAGGA